LTKYGLGSFWWTLGDFLKKRLVTLKLRCFRNKAPKCLQQKASGGFGLVWLGWREQQ
jgi:hypothetical protein